MAGLYCRSLISQTEKLLSFNFYQILFLNFGVKTGDIEKTFEVQIELCNKPIYQNVESSTVLTVFLLIKVQLDFPLDLLTYLLFYQKTKYAENL